MKKKVLSIVLSIVFMVSCIAGCGSADQNTSSSSGSGTEEDSGNSDSSVEQASGYKVAMLTDSSVSDGGWGASCYQAMEKSAAERGWESAYTDNVKTVDYVTVITEYAEQGYDMIFAPGNQYSDAVAQVAEEYPDIYFCLLNGQLEADNVTSVLPDAKQIGYMAGALAGLMSMTNSIGFIGGMELDTTKEKLDSYTKAAQKVNSDIQVQSAYAGSFDDTAMGKEIASSMISTYDVDIMFGDASAVDTGAREALGESSDRYDIGQPGDLGSKDDAVIINSVVTDNAALVKECMEDVENGTYGNKTVYGNLSNGCLSIGTYSSLVPDDIKEQYGKIVEEIKNGTFITE